MSIEFLSINNIRVIKHAELEPSSGINLITGPNAAGKTSILEAIDVLSRGRSFRTRLLKHLITAGELQLTVTARLRQSRDSIVNIGLERSRHGARLRIQGKPANSIAELAALLPVQAIHPESHQLIQGGPAYRRAFLDWGTFHVKREFLPIWQRYQRALAQRNAALRANADSDTVRAWHGEMSETAYWIDHYRQAYIRELLPVVDESMALLSGIMRLGISYYSGWPQPYDLASVLDHELTTDLSYGHTRFGPHRAELELSVDGKPASGFVSRGQQKLLVIAMHLAQTRLLIELTQRPCIFLIDDLPAELGPSYRGRVLHALSELGAQLFITSIEAESLNLSAWADAKRFHVEQGHIQELI
ncbi:MAG TPA: DNA replication/repair protein RecF [Gammaproteobacteria bacterium]|nr:DNA replication/repair protein RecF [Gammaproteobacteria bacterium]